MKARIAFLLKHNSVLQKIYRVFGSYILRFIGLFVKTDPYLVVFISLMGTKFNDSPRAIYEYILDNENYKDYKLIWAFEKPSQFPNVPSVKLDSPLFFITALKAGYWISNTQFERGLTYKKKQTKYLYTMHGTAIKLCGNDCPGRNDFDYRTVDYLCVQSDFDKYVFERSFRARKSCFIESGRPCNDVLWHSTENDKIKMQMKLGLPVDKKIILYAPTWRDSHNGGKSYNFKPPIDFKAWEKHLSDHFIILFRAHHITTKVLNIQFDSFLRDYSDYPDINDLYIASDILITDYSSVMVDFAILERPIFCFAYDYDDYLRERGTYFELDEHLPNKSFRTENDLLKAIIQIDYEEQRERTRKFKEKFDQYGGNGVYIAVNTMFGC